MKPRCKNRALRATTVFLIYCAITAVFFWPVVRHLSGALIGPAEDNFSDFWNLWYATNAANLKHFFFTTLIRFPEGSSLLYQSFTYPHMLVIMLITQLTGASHASLTVLQNLSILLSFPLAGLGGYALIRHFSVSRSASLIGGFVYAFNPSHVAHAFHHMGVSQIEFFPFFALCWILTITRKSYAWLAAAVLCYVLAALCCWYYLFFVAFFVIFYAIYLRLRDDELPKGWRLGAPLLCFAATALLLTPLIIPMLQIGNVGGDTGDYPGNNILTADLLSFMTFPPHHMLGDWSAPLFQRFTGNSWEVAVYLGLINLALLIWSLPRTEKHFRNFILSGLITFAVLAMGNSLHVGGHVLTFFHLPNLLLSHLPFTSVMRAPGRYMVWSYLFLALGVGYGFMLLQKRAAGGWQKAGLAALAALIILDFRPVDIPVTSSACPAVLDTIARDPDKNTGVVDLPLSYENADIAMFRQSCHGHPIVAAIVSRVTTPALVDHLESEDLTRQRRQLEQARVRYIIWNRDAEGSTPEKVHAMDRMYKKMASGDNLILYRVY